jgi:hypothetical protein
MKLRFFIIVFAIGFLNQSCENEGVNPNEQKISAFGSTESHNTGQGCISCHVSGGDGEGWFSVAGTVYDSLITTPYPNATIELYTEPGGTGLLAYTVQADALGNFYTTENIDLGNGLYPAVKGSKVTKYMQSTITAGDCNGCHGVSVDRIWVK